MTFGERIRGKWGNWRPQTTFSRRRSSVADISRSLASRSLRRWGVAGASLGALVSLLAFLPAALLAGVVGGLTNQRLQLADARGTVWSGSAVAVLTGGRSNRDASRLPGRLHWEWGWTGDGRSDPKSAAYANAGSALELRVRHACCLNGVVRLLLRPGSLTLLPAGDRVGQWPAAWLRGLGAPWNTFRLDGTVRVTSDGLTVATTQRSGRLRGRITAELLDVSSPLSPLPIIGSYRLTLEPNPTVPGATSLTLTTEEGALSVSGAGTWDAAGVHFRGEASAAEDDEEALGNLLNIIGPREGARSVISIG